MLLPIIFSVLYVASFVAFFLKPDIPQQYKRTLLYLHFLATLLLVAIIVCTAHFDISFRPWVISLPSFLFFSTAIGLFALYRSALHPLLKLYFGFFFAYPVLALTTFFIDRIMFIIAIALVVGPLFLPTTLYSGNRYDIRSSDGSIMEISHITLVEKNWLTEKTIGSNSDIQAQTFTDETLQIVEQTPDSAVVIVAIDGVPTKIVFN